MVAAEGEADGTTQEDVLAWGRRLVDPELRAAVDTLPGQIRLVAGHHFGWWDRDGQPCHAPSGKALRPTLTRLAAEAIGGDPVAALPAAVAVELVHNFSLLHDDVMDGDVTRRHRPTAWSVFGIGSAILTGDALLTLAFDVLAAADHPAVKAGGRMLNAAVVDLISGQSTDVALERRGDVSLHECQRMARAKTAALLGCACALGAAFGSGDPEQVERLRGFGERLGLAFQYVDDLLGIWGDPAVTGKPVHSDLHTRKKSLPVVAALNSDTPEADELAALYAQDRPLSGRDLVRAADLIEHSGGRAWCQRQAAELLRGALHDLGSANATPRARGALAELGQQVVRRDR